MPDKIHLLMRVQTGPSLQGETHVVCALFYDKELAVALQDMMIDRDRRLGVEVYRYYIETRRVGDKEYLQQIGTIFKSSDMTSLIIDEW